MDIWERQRDLIELKLIRVRADLAEVKSIQAAPVVQEHASLVARVDRVIKRMEDLCAFYERQKSEAEHRMQKGEIARVKD